MKRYWNLLLGRTDASHPASFSLRNIKAVWQAFFRKTKRKIDGFELEDHIYEQIIWRRVEVRWNSPKCWYSNSCKICGCDILGKTMEDRACSLSEHPELNRVPCYPAMMTKEEWILFKEKKKIKLFD